MPLSASSSPPAPPRACQADHCTLFTRGRRHRPLVAAAGRGPGRARFSVRAISCAPACPRPSDRTGRSRRAMRSASSPMRSCALATRRSGRDADPPRAGDRRPASAARTHGGAVRTIGARGGVLEVGAVADLTVLARRPSDDRAGVSRRGRGAADGRGRRDRSSRRPHASPDRLTAPLSRRGPQPPTQPPRSSRRACPPARPRANTQQHIFSRRCAAVR